MISVHREYELIDVNHSHAHVEINPIGLIDVEIMENKQHHQAEFSELSFQKVGGHTRLCGKQNKKPWQLELDNKDAEEINRLIDQASEEFETLMRDL
ncbi:hypothetical protein [Vibrio tubiashii]|uniref:Uncharacterized protein n=1 Tax=Vibrio tubiashii TaxID=29498 RepID=A0AAE5GMI5_9VIBR|nr:hypothetical protein [Vibrio tubiashii]MCG9581458.1 hypothetical protein [Vibrio tubiashii]MCG9615049.1 hypothetical protein [Vibrio tubiashii]MCG9689847.1 hypothetical protein [Vibrio tubiashii]NOI79544.1 hypothetical protein [Vibrio tubiashii]